jgi:hypothetical protein
MNLILTCILLTGNLKSEKSCHSGNRKHILNESDVTIPKGRKRMQSLAQEFTAGNNSTIKNRTFPVITVCSIGGKPVNSALQNRTVLVRTGQLVRLVIKNDF